ncbi:MAG: hypothetical protein ACRD17_04965 [Terriglobales bacterium]
MRRALAALVVLSAFAPLLAQSANKLRVLAAPGVTQLKPKDWHNSLAVAASSLVLDCPKCAPIQAVSIPQSEIAGLRYGQNAYHHWVSGVVTGIFSLGIGAIVGFMPHHQHFFSIDLKDGKVLAIQADKHDYREIAGMLENFAGLPIQVSAKDAHFLDGFNTQVVGTAAK